MCHTPLFRQPFSCRPKILSSLIIRRPSLIYYYHHSRYYQQHSCLHTTNHSYQSHRAHECSNVNSESSTMDSSPRDQGVYGDSHYGSSDCQPGVGTEREEDRLGRADDSSRKMRSDARSHAVTNSTSTSKSETFISPYGDYDMDESSFFAHTTRLNIVGPNPNSAQFQRRRSPSSERFFIKYQGRSMDKAFNKKSRSRSPSPFVPEKPTSPTESYLQQSLQPSLPLPEPTALRKLLVLDLNGTLLLRSNHSGRRAPQSYPGHSSSTSRTTILPALRTVYPRPYLPSFCAYIFHPLTQQWLDTMVWSSAQPHSVTDMVDKCFGTYKWCLKAVWARDTLGLSSDEYRE